MFQFDGTSDRRCSSTRAPASPWAGAATGTTATTEGATARQPSPTGVMCCVPIYGTLRIQPRVGGALSRDGGRQPRDRPRQVARVDVVATFELVVVDRQAGGFELRAGLLPELDRDHRVEPAMGDQHAHRPAV